MDLLGGGGGAGGYRASGYGPAPLQDPYYNLATGIITL
jgi:hypothetical protein